MAVISRPTGISKLDLFMKDVVDAFKKLLQVRLNSQVVGTKSSINFIAGTGITITVTDNPDKDCIDVTVELS